jgi:hypothetical protein
MFLGSFSTFIYDLRDGGKRAPGSSRNNAGYTSEEKREKKKKKKKQRNGVGQGREVERVEPSTVASEQTGLMDRTM